MRNRLRAAVVAGVLTAFTAFTAPAVANASPRHTESSVQLASAPGYACDWWGSCYSETDIWGNPMNRDIWGNPQGRDIWGNSPGRDIWGNSPSERDIWGNSTSGNGSWWGTSGW